MSLYLPEQKLGSHSEEGGSSNKFILKGRQTGSMHRGHTWVFRAESHDTMMAWYEDIKALTEKTPEERSQFVRSHSRSLSRSSRRSVSSDGLLDEDEDEEPFSADSEAYINPGPKHDSTPRRSLAGGRFPSDIQVNAQRGLQASHSPSSVSSGGFKDQQQDPATSDARATPAGIAAVAAGSTAAGVYGASRSQENHVGYGSTERTPMDEVPSNAAIANHEAQQDGVNPYTSEPVQQTEITHQPSQYQQNYQSQYVPQQYQQTQTPYQDQNQAQPQPLSQNQNYIVPVIAPQNQQQYTDPQVVDSGEQQRDLNGLAEPGLSQQSYNGGLYGQQYADVGAEAKYNNNLDGGNGLSEGYDNHNNFVEGNNYNVTAVNTGGYSDRRLSEAHDSQPVPLQNLMEEPVESPAQQFNQGSQALSSGGLVQNTETRIPTPPPAPIPVPAGESLPGAYGSNPVRPTSNNTRNDSVQTISNLHIPGGYPKNAA